MPKVLWNNKLPTSLVKVEWFCWFFACSYLHLVWYPLKLPKFAILVGIVRHRFSANQIVRCFKFKKMENYMRLIVCFRWSYKKYLAILGYAAKYSWCISCRIFYFWLVWLVNFNTGGPLLHCTCCILKEH